MSLHDAALSLVRAYDAYNDALNGLGHPGEAHDRVLHFEPCTNLPGVAHVYSDSSDCAACGGAQYGSEHDVQVAVVALKLALAEPLRPYEEHQRGYLAEPVA